MTIIEPIAMEFAQEAGNTRRILERVPEEHFDWKPHEKSMSLAELATHVAQTPEWGMLWVQPSNYSAVGRYERPMRVEAPLGEVRLGG